MDSRKKRLADDSPSSVPASGAEVFRPARDDSRPQVRIPLSVESDGRGGFIERGIVARWPPQTARAQTGQAEEVPREVIYLKGRNFANKPLKPDYYLEAEERARARNQ